MSKGPKRDKGLREPLAQPMARRRALLRRPERIARLPVDLAHCGAMAPSGSSRCRTVKDAPTDGPTVAKCVTPVTAERPVGPSLAFAR